MFGYLVSVCCGLTLLVFPTPNPQPSTPKLNPTHPHHHPHFFGRCFSVAEVDIALLCFNVVSGTIVSPARVVARVS